MVLGWYLGLGMGVSTWSELSFKTNTLRETFEELSERGIHWIC